jgi:hypothetical protein
MCRAAARRVAPRGGMGLVQITDNSGDASYSVAGDWRLAITHAVDLLLRRAERCLDDEVKAAFTAGESGSILLRQTELAQVREFRQQLRTQRFAEATDGELRTLEHFPPTSTPSARAGDE